MILVGVATVAGLIVPDPWLRLGLLELGALADCGCWSGKARERSRKADLPRGGPDLGFVSRRQRSAYWSADRQEWAWALLITSVCVKLAAVPLFFWLLSLADELPALVLGLIIAVVDMAAFGEFWISAHIIPDCYLPHALLLGVAAATSFLAALLMLTQRSLKRLLVLSTVEDVGFLLLGSLLVERHSESTARCLPPPPTPSPRLCSSSASAAPKPTARWNGEPTGLATRYPVAAFGFLFGMLAMLGIPPTMGFLGRWRLYETAVQIGWPLAAVFILSSIFALIAYVLALTRIWWGPPR